MARQRLRRRPQQTRRHCTSSSGRMTWASEPTSLRTYAGRSSPSTGRRRSSPKACACTRRSTATCRRSRSRSSRNGSPRSRRTTTSRSSAGMTMSSTRLTSFPTCRALWSRSTPGAAGSSPWWVGATSPTAPSTGPRRPRASPGPASSRSCIPRRSRQATPRLTR